MKKTKINLFRIFMTVFVIYSVITLINLQFKIESSKKQNEELEQKIQQIQKENERLKAELESSSTLEYLEKAAREQLGMVKPGEKVFIKQTPENSESKEEDKQ
ncbi:MAG: FtsB family cell division protein [Bacillota bacterium]